MGTRQTDADTESQGATRAGTRTPAAAGRRRRWSRSPVRMRAVAVALLGGLGPACNPPAVAPPDDATGTGTTAATTEVGTTFGALDACQSSDECETEGLCIAPYDPAGMPPMGAGACIEACIDADDLTRWCFDDDGCCGDLRCNAVDGLCEATSASDSTSGGSTGTSTGGSDSGSTGTTGGSDSGTSTGSGSGTGASTGTSAGSG